MQFRIGEASRLSQLPVKTIRYYCDQGLIQPTERTEAGYRLFDAQALEELDLIKKLRSLDVSLADIQRILDARRSGFCACDDLRATLVRYSALIEERISSLHTIRTELDALASSWELCGRPQRS